MKKKILAVILMVCMIMIMIPMNVFAAGQQQENNNSQQQLMVNFYEKSGEEYKFLFSNISDDRSWWDYGTDHKLYVKEAEGFSFSGPNSNVVKFVYNNQVDTINLTKENDGYWELDASKLTEGVNMGTLEFGSSTGDEQVLISIYHNVAPRRDLTSIASSTTDKNLYWIPYGEDNNTPLVKIDVNDNAKVKLEEGYDRTQISSEIEMYNEDEIDGYIAIKKDEDYYAVTGLEQDIKNYSKEFIQVHNNFRDVYHFFIESRKIGSTDIAFNYGNENEFTLPVTVTKSSIQFYKDANLSDENYVETIRYDTLKDGYFYIALKNEDVAEVNDVEIDWGNDFQKVSWSREGSAIKVKIPAATMLTREKIRLTFADNRQKERSIIILPTGVGEHSEYFIDKTGLRLDVCNGDSDYMDIDASRSPENYYMEFAWDKELGDKYTLNVTARDAADKEKKLTDDEINTLLTKGTVTTEGNQKICRITLNKYIGYENQTIEFTVAGSTGELRSEVTLWYGLELDLDEGVDLAKPLDMSEIKSEKDNSVYLLKEGNGWKAVPFFGEISRWGDTNDNNEKLRVGRTISLDIAAKNGYVINNVEKVYVNGNKEKVRLPYWLFTSALYKVDGMNIENSDIWGTYSRSGTETWFSVIQQLAKYIPKGYEKGPKEIYDANPGSDKTKDFFANCDKNGVTDKLIFDGTMNVFNVYINWNGKDNEVYSYDPCKIQITSSKVNTDKDIGATGDKGQDIIIGQDNINDFSAFINSLKKYFGKDNKIEYGIRLHAEEGLFGNGYINIFIKINDGKEYRLFWMKDGIPVPMDFDYVYENGRIIGLTFVTGHFSDYVLALNEDGGTTPGGSTTGGGAVMPPAADEDDVKTTTDNTTSEIKTSTTIKDTKTETVKNEQGEDISKVTATVSEKVADNLVEQAVSNKSDTVEITVKSNAGNKAEQTEVEIPKKAVESIAKDTNADLVIKTDSGQVTLDNKTLETIAEEAEGDTVKITVNENTQLKEEQKPASDVIGDNGKLFDLKAVIGDKILHDFRGGKAHVTLPMPEKLKGKDIVIIYINDKGICEILNHTMETIGAEEYIKFTTSHFSNFAVVEKADAEKLIAKQNADKINSLIREAKLKATTSKTSKKNVRVKVSVKNNNSLIKEAKAMGYTVKYKFYKSTKKSSKYKAVKTKTSNSYINTKGKKGTRYYYKAKVMVYGGKNLIAQTELKQCSYGARTCSK